MANTQNEHPDTNADCSGTIRRAAAAASQNYERHFHAAACGYLILTTDGTILDVNQTLVSWTGQSRNALLGTSVVDLMPLADQVLFTSYAVPQLAVAGCFNEMAADLVSMEGGCIPVLLSGVRSEGGSENGEGGDDAVAVDRIAVFNASERRTFERELVAALRKAEAAEAARAAAEEELRDKQKALEDKDRVLQENLEESRKREALLETVLNAADVGLLVVDTHGDTVLTNTHLMSTWRRTAGNIPVGLNEQLVFRADRVTPAAGQDNPIPRAAAGETFSDQLLWFGIGENQMAVNVAARPIKASGVLSGSVIAFSDVTRLVRAVASQEEFVGNVSHELRTPLTSIMGYLDLVLEDERLHPQLVGALNVALHNSERLLTLVSDLLSVASGTKKMERRPVNLAEIIREGVLSIALRAELTGVDVTSEIPASLTADVDPHRLAQVIDNLLTNAVKYSPNGGTVAVRLWQDRQAVRLQVADTGIGMSEAEQAMVFTKFFRGARAVASAVPGVGLGLVITKSIVDAHGGQLSFVSSLGQGSVFTVSLPRTAQGSGS
ncbi:PAS domain-containing protein [Arthrobacter jiangjiafuii]|uniref:histidine kinase n=1 Tax=Arthrobacter jiangjiafuii TaxID=2817475 RepID=A0A975R110_9MICC|nr:ATP-binding protein [Arthrobacter jiangjiafuii]MBP3042968.1 PAS domain-containing protein [Arthrobacter jiangjiafuii]QWC11495.1 PAS domain-containing protein [Arthrobacter jiangjiafuii]